MEAAWKRPTSLLSTDRTTKEGNDMFDLEKFINDCIEAGAETEPRLAVKAALERAMYQPGTIADALPAVKSEIVPLYISDTLSIIKAVWAPGMGFRPHNHLMWAAIGLYVGQEDNTLYRRCGDGIVVAGGRQLRGGDVILLGDDTIHAVSNPLQSFTGAIHVYGGNITARPGRSEWDEAGGAEVAYDFARTRQYFASFQAPAVTD
jgi:predicted metal-dependent enzyme (double-stranded beta helix superfamily)